MRLDRSPRYPAPTKHGLNVQSCFGTRHDLWVQTEGRAVYHAISLYTNMYYMFVRVTTIKYFFVFLFTSSEKYLGPWRSTPRTMPRNPGRRGPGILLTEFGEEKNLRGLMIIHDIRMGFLPAIAPNGKIVCWGKSDFLMRCSSWDPYQTKATMG